MLFRSEEKLEPNYNALRDLEALVIPKAPVKFEIDNVTKGRHVGGVLGGTQTPEMKTDEFPKLTARIEREDEDGILEREIVIGESPDEDGADEGHTSEEA